MIADKLEFLIAKELPYTPTSGQHEATKCLAHFLTTSTQETAFILHGYAGTGKTSLVGALVRTLKRLKRDVVLMAPTGRAAKVFSAHAGLSAFTIHRIIYRQQTFQGEGTRFSLGFNTHRHAVFIVDEASMISQGGSGLFGSGLLLDDLIRYVYEAEGCRLLLVGDTAQLPPVGEEESPALNKDFISRYGLSVNTAELTEVVRQGKTSSVLAGATHLRQLITNGSKSLPRINGSHHGEIRFLPGDEFIETLISAYSDCGTDDVIVITRSNKRSNLYNSGIRSLIFEREEPLTRGDIIMAVKNNYHWTERLQEEADGGDAAATCPMAFIANGDTAQVVRVSNVHEQYGFHFANATLRFTDYGQTQMTCRVLLDTLMSEAPALTPEQSRRLYEAVSADYDGVTSRRERMRSVRGDAYYNALQIKYAYAVTCHKAQGGQWSRVFVESGWRGTDTGTYLRWLYTALTRTTGLLYLVNWPKEQRGEKKDEGDA